VTLNKFNLFIFFLLSSPCIVKQINAQEYTMPSFVHAIDACDMDMDGSNDIVVSCGYEDSIVIMNNDGYGNFELSYFHRITGSLICGCVDGDSLPDIIAGKGQLYYYKNLGDHSIDTGVPVMNFPEAFALYYLIDMNDDGWNDLTYDMNTHWGVYKNNGDLTFTNIIIGNDNATSPQPSIGYLNNDSLFDIIVSYSYEDGSQVTKYYINEGNLVFNANILNETVNKPLVSHLDTLFPDDLLLFYNPTPDVYLYENIGNSTFISRGFFNVMNTRGVYFADLADYNLDGYDDFSYTQCYWSGCTDSLYLEINDNWWSFLPAQQYYVGSLNFFKIRSIDLNGDDFPDFFMTGYNSNNKVKILWNNGDGTFSYLNPVSVNQLDLIKSNTISIYPNPFSINTIIDVPFNKRCVVNLKIFDIRGQELITLIKSKEISEGSHQFLWDGQDYWGKSCSSGIYIVVLDIDGEKYSKKIIRY
jgi:hypothetical protein